MNKGKDFSGGKVEITARTYKSTFIAFSTMDYDLYRKGANREAEGNIFFTRIAVSFASKMASYRFL